MRKKFMISLLVFIVFGVTSCVNSTTTSTISTTTTTSEITSVTTTTTADVLSIVEGIEDQTIIKGHYFDLLEGVVLSSLSGEDLTPYLEITGHVDYSQVGSYVLNYSLDYNDYHYLYTRTITVTEGTYNAVVNSRPISAGSTVCLENGGYRTGTNTSLIHPTNPTNLEYDLYDYAIPSNGWWTSLLVQNYGGGNGIYTNPYRTSFSTSGMEITNAGEGFTQYWNPEGYQTIAQFSLSLKDMYLKTSDLALNYQTKVIDYSDASVRVAMRNTGSTVDSMVVDLVQGSPYIFAQVANPTTPYLLLDTAGVDNYEYYDLEGNLITSSTYTGNAVIVKLVHRHAGYICTPPANVGSPIYKDMYYLVSTPENTQFTISSFGHPFGLNNKLAFNLGDSNYFSVANLNDLSEASFYHQYAYTSQIKTMISYDVNHQTNEVITNYDFITNTLNEEEPSESLSALMPHLYKYSTAILTDYSYDTVRGNLKVMIGNHFKTSLTFEGLLPSYTIPEDLSFSETLQKSYLEDLDARTDLTDLDNFLNADEPYWNSKALYPLSQGLIIAHEINDSTLEASFILKLRYLLTDWYSYSGLEDTKYLYYNEPWGSVYYSDNEFNTASELSDHSFTHGYLIFASAVLAMYDPDFVSEYGEMVNFLLNDYLYPYRDSSEFAYLRSFDPWAGHSWAHGFGTFAEGNNLESSSEALNSWAAGYLWALVSEDQERMDAAIYGFTTELSSVKEYWFDYDSDNWNDSYSDYASVVGMIWGGKFDYATWFGANPTFIYGIQWLPTGEYLTSYAMNDIEYNKLDGIFSAYLEAKNGVIDTWYSNMWSIMAIISPIDAINAFDASKILNDDYPSELSGTYYMIHALNTLGRRTSDITFITDTFTSASIYVNDLGEYYAMVWNPLATEQTVSFRLENGEILQFQVDANSFTKLMIE